MDTNNQETGQDVYGIIGELGKCGAGKEVIQIAKEDMEFGIDHDTILWYGESGWGANRIREFSKIVRSTTDNAFIRFIQDGKFTVAQMEILLEFHKKEVPLEKLAELMGQEKTPYELRSALSGIYAGMRQIGSQTGGAEFEEIKKQVSSLAENIGKNHKFYESVSEQLKKIGDAREDADSVRAELSAEIDQRDKMLGDQQDNLNKVHAQMAALRSEKAALEKKVEELKEKEGNAGKYEAEAAKLKEAKENLEAELKDAREKTASLSLELSGAKAERDLKAAELEREKAENIRLSGELEKIREELEQVKEKPAASEGVQERSLCAGFQTGSTGKQGKTAESEEVTGNMVAGEHGKIPSGKGKGTSGSERGIMEDYQTVIRTGSGEIPVTVEHSRPERRDGFFAMLGKKLFGDKKRMRIIKAVAAAKLDKEQMKQVKNAVKAGLLENEVIDIINSGFDAEEMEQAVEIVLAEKSY